MLLALMADLKLTYFDFPGSRGEECRLALHAAGLAFEDERITTDTWRERRSSAPFLALPILEVAGKGVLAQSNAILAFVGRAHGLHPSDPWQAAQHEAILISVEDLRSNLNPTGRIKDPDEKKKAREEFAKGYLRDWAGAVSKQIASGPFVAGDKLHVADIKVYIIMRSFISGGIDHVPGAVFDEFPQLTTLYRAVESHPAVVSWNAKANAKG
jgi:prostaglandin-H2 D-isomerase / glutathione transferase